MNQKDRFYYRKVTGERLIQLLLSKLNIPSKLSDLVTITKLSPKDLGVESWHVKQEDWIHVQVPPRSAWAFYKFCDLSSEGRVSNIEFYQFTTLPEPTNPLWYGDLSEMYAVRPLLKVLKSLNKEEITYRFGDLENLKAEAYLSEPLVYQPYQWCTIKGKYLPGSPPPELCLVGFCATIAWEFVNR